MGQTTDFKCPYCGGFVEFDPASQRFKCLYCSQLMTEEQLQEPSATEKEQEESGYRAYHCQSCGAQIVTTDTTAATRCYSGHNPVVLSDRLEGEFRPDGVIPFELDKKGAKEVFGKFIKGKKFVDRQFYADAQLEDFSGVYYPYWMADVDAEASFTGTGTRVNVMRGAQYTTTVTKQYRVEREGKITFRNMFRKALSSADRILAEGIHPYRYEETKAYNPGYLSGFMAEMRDVEAEKVRKELSETVRQQAPSLMKQGSTLGSLTGETSIRSAKVDMKYVLLPAWVLTYKGKKQDGAYYYMMNGQTGEVCGKLPIDWRRLGLCCLAAGAAVFALLCMGGALLW